MTSHPKTEGAIGTPTNGIGSTGNTGHLNLTVSLADADRRPKKRIVGRLLTAEERSRRISEGRRAQIINKAVAIRAEAEAEVATKVRFAGFDPHEVRLKLPRQMVKRPLSAPADGGSHG